MVRQTPPRRVLQVPLGALLLWLWGATNLASAQHDLPATQHALPARTEPEGSASGASQPARADDDPPGALTAVSQIALLERNPGHFQPLIKGLILEQLPPVYENKKRWGQTKEVYAGLRVSHKGLRITTKRRRKTVNHGSWKMYRLQLQDPARDLQLSWSNFRAGQDKQVSLDLDCQARLQCFGRWSQWERGVQLFSLSADAEAKVRARLRCEMSLRTDWTRIPPDLVMDPVVRQASLELVSFRLRRLSNVGGPWARELGEGVREVLEEVLKQQRASLVGKLNRQIDKKRDKLRFSMAQTLSAQWDRLLDRDP